MADHLVIVKPMLERVRNWEEYLGTKDTESAFESIRKHTRTGRPSGGEQFVEMISNLAGQQLVKEKPDPKPR